MPAPAIPSWFGLKHVVLLAGGGVAFFAINAFLFLARCTSSEFMINCHRGTGEQTALVVIVAACVALAAALGRLGRVFAAGFAGALVALTAVSAGSCATPWIDPYYSAMRATAPYRQDTARDRVRREQHRAWVTAASGRAMDLARGVELAGAISACAQQEIARAGRVPADEQRVAASCADGRDQRAATDPGPGRRYGNEDDGWRWVYTPDATGYSIAVVPDEELPHKWPRVIAISDGRIHVALSENKTPFLINPAPDLARLARCLRGIPDAVELRTQQTGGLSYGWFLTSMARRLCGDLAPRLHAPVPNDENATLLAMVMPPEAGGAGKTVATYRIRIDIRQPADTRFAFDLHAAATTPGLPGFLATSEGVVYRTSASREARVSDLVVAR